MALCVTRKAKVLKLYQFADNCDYMLTFVTQFSRVLQASYRLVTQWTAGTELSQRKLVT